MRAVNALDFPGHERGNRAAAWQRNFNRNFNPAGGDARDAARAADRLATHDRRLLVDLEFRDHLAAMQVLAALGTISRHKSFYACPCLSLLFLKVYF